MWQVFDDHQILYHTLTKLSITVAVSSGSATSSICSGKRGRGAGRRSRKEQLEEKVRKKQMLVQSNIAVSMSRLAAANYGTTSTQIGNHLAQLRREMRELRRESQGATGQHHQDIEGDISTVREQMEHFNKLAKELQEMDKKDPFELMTTGGGSGCEQNEEESNSEIDLDDLDDE